MRTYQLYLIKDEFASHYFGRERMFYQLFAEYQNSDKEMKNILSKQIQYITKPILPLKLRSYILQMLQKRKDFRNYQGVYYIENGKKSWAKLELDNKHITIQAKGNYDAETVFFEVLRKNERFFLAVELSNHRYGWLKPIKERKLI